MEQRRKLPPLVYLAACIVLMLVMHRWLPLVQWVSPQYKAAAMVPAALGMVMTVMSGGAFLKAGTGLIPFDEATVLVTKGFFRFSRNPMYLGMVLFLLGIAVLLGSAGSLLPIPVFIAVIHWSFILAEERFMEAAFGDEYLAYKRRVRRWL